MLHKQQAERLVKPRNDDADAQPESRKRCSSLPHAGEYENVSCRAGSRFEAEDDEILDFEVVRTGVEMKGGISNAKIL